MLTLKHLLLAVSALSTALASPLNTITYSNVFGKHQKVHPVEGGGYIPVRYVGHDLRIAFAGHGWDHQCLEAFGARTENGQLVHVTDNCRWWQRDAIFRWNEDGTITYVGACLARFV